MIRNDGWETYSIWEHSETVRDLYARRCRKEAEEVTAHAQAAELLASHVRPGETVPDVGCGSGYFFHSLQSRSIPAEYWGVDASRALIEIGRSVMPQYGLPPERLVSMRFDDLAGAVDHIVCLNVLSNLDNYHRPLERFLRMARRTVMLRESLKHGAEYQYVRDDFLDPGVDLKVHVNHYDIGEISSFVQEQGYRVALVTDRRTGGRPEQVIGYEHHWTFLLAERASATTGPAGGVSWRE